jgi:hypothetical protein
MAIKYIVLFVETPRKFITAVINLRGVSTNKTTYIYIVVARGRIDTILSFNTGTALSLYIL